MSASGSPAKRQLREAQNSGTAVEVEESPSRGNTKLRGITSFDEEEGDYMANMDGGSEDLDSSDLGSEEELNNEMREAPGQSRPTSSAKSFTLSGKGSKHRIRRKKATQHEEEKTGEGNDGGSLRKEGGHKMPSSINKPAADSILMLESVYQGRPATVFFPYTKACDKYRDPTRTFELTAEDMRGMSLSFRVNESTHVYNSVVNSLKRAGFKMMYSSNWNLLWTGWVKPETVKEATKFQRINHFPGTMQIGRKDNMWRNVSRLRRIHNADFDICP